MSEQQDFIEKARSPFSEAFEMFRKNHAAMAGLVVLIVIVLGGLIGPYVYVGDPFEMVWAPTTPPGEVTCDTFSKTIIDLLGVPIVSTSANISNQPFPLSYDDIDPEILQDADYVCLHNRSNKDVKKPSIIASYDKKGELIFLRS